MRYLFFIGMIVVITACGGRKKATRERPLAKVYDKFLYPSDLKGIIQPRMSKEDSTLVVGTFIENWAKQNLMIKVAEKNVPKNVNIDKIVEDYRAALIQHYYEKNLTEKLLDSLVDDSEIKAFYEKTRNEHILKHTIVRCLFIKFPKNTPEKENVQKWWKQERDIDLALLKRHCDMYAINYILEDSTWIRRDYLAAQLMDGAFNQGDLTKGRRINAIKDGAWYLLDVKAVVPAGQLAPVSYIRDKAIKYILHKRKIELIENIASEMYKRELNKKNVIIY